MSTWDVKVETDIDAAPEVVWKILADFENWDDWHGPGIEIKQEAERPKQLIFHAGPLPVAINLSGVKVIDGTSIQWIGALPFSRSLLYGKRKLVVEAISKGSCRFTQEESFFGLLSPLFRKKLSKLYQKNYSRFNENMKSVAESQSNNRLHSDRFSAASRLQTGA